MSPAHTLPIISSSPPPFPSLPPAPQLLPIPTCSPYPSAPSPADLSPADIHADPTPTADTSSFTPTAADTFLPSSSHSPNSRPSTTSSDPSPLVAKSTSSHHMVTRSKAGVFKPKTLYLVALDPSSTVPRSISIALTIPVWKAAMTAEFLALLRNKTWILTLLPLGKNLIGCTWIFRIKHVSGLIARHKARLVA